MKRILLSLFLTLTLTTSGFAYCECRGWIDGYYVKIFYTAANDDCANPDAINYSSGVALVVRSPMHIEAIFADPIVCIN